ncbi:hypothetical protein KY325_04835 [Candidatus Woesearchaeota archaeon]|nr:hypothetical protein [Candidatus Woesearchaeota archaeon]
MYDEYNRREGRLYDSNKHMRRMTYVIGGLTGAMILTVMATAIGSYNNFCQLTNLLKDRTRCSTLFKEASKIADNDKDGVTTKDEWKALFKKHGVHFDEEGGNFTLENLEKLAENEEK